MGGEREGKLIVYENRIPVSSFNEREQAEICGINGKMNVVAVKTQGGKAQWLKMSPGPRRSHDRAS